MKKIFLIILFAFVLTSCQESTEPMAEYEAPSLSTLVWQDNTTNPILNEFKGGSPYGPYFARVIYDGGLFKMWYANSYGNDKYDIGYAESADGISWTIVKENALTAGPPESWDSYSVHPGAVIKDGSVYKMYYCGQSTPNDQNDKRIGLATSVDGVNWTRSSINTVNQINIKGYSTDIVKDGGTYYLYYGNADVIGVATSTDGLNWSRSQSSIIRASYQWEGSRIWSCTVIKEGRKFKMIYTTSLMNSFGYAESEDGITWIKNPTPIFTYFQTQGRTSSNVRYPLLRKINNKYYLYYSTVDSYYCTIRVATGTF